MDHRRTNVTNPRPLVEGALLAAVAVVLSLIGYYVPIIGPLVVFLWPVPIAIIQIRHGLRFSLLTVVVAGLLLASLIGPLDAVAIVATFGIVGIGFGIGVGRKLSAIEILIIGAVAMLASTLVSLGLSFVFMGVKPAQMLEELRQGIETATGIYSRLGMSPEMIEQAKKMLTATVELMRVVFPALFVAAAVIQSFINFSVLRAVLQRLGYSVAELPKFDEWRFPSWFALLFLTGVALVATNQAHHSVLLYNIGLNLYSFFSLAFMIQGISVGYWWLGKWNLPKGMRIALAVFASFNPTLAQLLTWLGVLDVALNFRRREATVG
ncbi:MAG TPA: YybS family protein [Firmicutes bacterium]|nr:YybS family protein [Bacillota bacterium]